MLLDVVDEGTALEAALDNYMLAGKTGTPRGTVRGHYVPGRYNPNFVGLFPGDNPQYVIVVKLTAPQSSIFAAKTAAPVTKAILEAAIAARNAALDRGRLASSLVPTKKDSSPTGGDRCKQARARRATRGNRDATDSARARGESVPYVVTLPLRREAAPPREIHPCRTCAVSIFATRCVRCTVRGSASSSLGAAAPGSSGQRCRGHEPGARRAGPRGKRRPPRHRLLIVITE